MKPYGILVVIIWRKSRENACNFRKDILTHCAKSLQHCKICKNKKNKGKEEKCKLTHYALSTIAEPSSEGGLRCPWLRGLHTPLPP